MAADTWHVCRDPPTGTASRDLQSKPTLAHERFYTMWHLAPGSMATDRDVDVPDPEHPRIVADDTFGGEPRIRSRRITVLDVYEAADDPEWVPDVLSYGADDFDEILPHCRETRMVLVTSNVRDFNETGLADGEHAGIVIVHDKERPLEDIAAGLHRITAAYPSREAF